MVMRESAKSWWTRWRKRILADGGKNFKSEIDSFLSDPGIPGVRSMGPSVSNKQVIQYICYDFFT